MTTIDIFGWPIPLEWFIPITIWLMITTLFSIQYLFFSKKKAGTSTFAIEFDKTGLAPNPPVKLKPENEKLTTIAFEQAGKQREVRKFLPLTVYNPTRKIWERHFYIPKDSDDAWNPATAFDDAMKTKSPSRMMQEFAVWLGNIRGMLQNPFGLKKNAFMILMILGFGIMTGVFLADYVLPALARNYH